LNAKYFDFYLQVDLSESQLLLAFRNFSQATDEARRLIDFLPWRFGSEQRPHQKTQSKQQKTSPESAMAKLSPLKNAR
jgi:hypothetical protein